MKLVALYLIYKKTTLYNTFIKYLNKNKNFYFIKLNVM